MLGNPKFDYGEKVRCAYTDERGYEHNFTGTIAIIDKYGTFGDDSDVSYDVLSKDFYGTEQEVLVKHINEKFVEKI